MEALGAQNSPIVQFEKTPTQSHDVANSSQLFSF